MDFARCKRAIEWTASAYIAINMCFKLASFDAHMEYDIHLTDGCISFSELLHALQALLSAKGSWSYLFF